MISSMVSIIITVRSRTEYMKNCIERIRLHTPEPHEIIVIDCGHSSKTTKWLEKSADAAKDIRIISVGEKNTGYAAMCNKGIQESSGEYIALLSDNVMVTAEWLSGMLECLHINSHTAAVGPMMSDADGIQGSIKHVFSSPGSLDDFAKQFRTRNRYRRIPARKINGSCMLFRREFVTEIGLLDESFETPDSAGEDFCLRAVTNGYRNVIAADVFVSFHTPENGKTIINSDTNLLINKWRSINENSALWKSILTVNTLVTADELYQKGQPDTATFTLLQDLKESPGDIRVYHALADMLIDTRQYQDALDLLETMPEGLKQDRGRLERIGYCKEGMELYDEAIRYADEALALDKTSAKAWNLKGTVAFKRGIHAEAEEFFRKAIESDRGFGEAYANLGALHWTAGRHEEAFDLFEKAFILSPTAQDIVINYYTAALSLSRMGKAEGVFKEAIALYPLNKRLKFILGDLLLQESKYEKAMEVIEEAIGSFGADSDTLAVALELRSMVGVPKVDKNSPDTISLCMIVKNEEKDIGKCLKSIKPAVDEMIVVDTGSTDRTKDIVKVFGAMAYDFAWTDNFSDARNFSLSKATGKWILILDADEVISSGDFDALRNLIKKAAKRPAAYSITSRNYVSQLGIGCISNDGKYFKEESGSGWVPSEKVRLFPNDHRIHFENPVHELVENSILRAGMEIKKCGIPVHHYGKLNRDGNQQKAEEYYELGKKKLAEQGENDPQAVYELAIQASELGKHEEALEYWKKLAFAQPKFAMAFHGLGNSLFRLGRYDEALRNLVKAIELNPDSEDAITIYAQCKVCTGNAEEAISLLEGLLKKAPLFPMALLVTAVAFFCVNRREKGLEYVKKLRNMNFLCADFFADFAEILMSAKQFNYACNSLEAAKEYNEINEKGLALLAKCLAEGNVP